MIDVLNQVNAIVRDALKDTPYENIPILGEYIRVPSVFPCITVEEISNVPVREYIDSESSEDFARIQYRVQVFSNNSAGKRAQAREIVSYVSNRLQEYGFLRITYDPIPELYMSTCYEITCVFEGVISKDEVVYHN